MQENIKNPKIAIDGPAGAGKSTVAREVARRLGIRYLDTGAMYRAITLKIIRENIALENLAAIDALLDRTKLELTEERRVIMDGEDVSFEIRQPHVNGLVSPVSAIPLVRRRLVQMQKEIAAAGGGIIMEGRDITSIVMPDADYKFYLDASIEERAERRRKEQLEKGLALEADQVIAEIENRDRIDSGRADSPLCITPDATVIDTTAMTFEEVVQSVLRLVKQNPGPGETGRGIT